MVMIARWLRSIGLLLDRTAASPPDARLEVVVAGERWRPVASIAGAGPDDQVYVLAIERDGSGVIRFGDGTTGQRPATGSSLRAAFRRGAGAAGNVWTDDLGQDPGIALLELLSFVADELTAYQDAIAAEAYLETAGERRSVSGLVEAARTLVEDEDVTTICVCFRLRGRSSAA
jgi:hypothetical protein